MKSELTVLIIEKNDDLRELVREVAEKRQMRVWALDDVKKAMIFSKIIQFDIVICEYEQSPYNGLHFFHFLKNEYSLAQKGSPFQGLFLMMSHAYLSTEKLPPEIIFVDSKNISEIEFQVRAYEEKVALFNNTDHSA